MVFCIAVTVVRGEEEMAFETPFAVPAGPTTRERTQNLSRAASHLRA